MEDPMKGKKSALLVAAVLTAVVLVIISLIARSGTFQSASTVKNIVMSKRKPVIATGNQPIPHQPFLI